MSDFDDYMVTQMIAAFDASPIAVTIDEKRLHAIINLIRKDERSNCIQQVQSIKNTPAAEHGKTLLDVVINILNRD